MNQAVLWSELFDRGLYLDILFIGLDYDDKNRIDFKMELDTLYNKITHQKLKSKAIILFPVQAIEHWLLFVKKKIENPASTKNIANDIEKIERTAAKIMLYEKNKKVNIDILIKHTQALDVDWLSNQSASFNAFYQKFRTAISQ